MTRLLKGAVSTGESMPPPGGSRAKHLLVPLSWSPRGKRAGRANHAVTMYLLGQRAASSLERYIFGSAKRAPPDPSGDICLLRPWMDPPNDWDRWELLEECDRPLDHGFWHACFLRGRSWRGVRLAWSASIAFSNSSPRMIRNLPQAIRAPGADGQDWAVSCCSA